MSFRRFLYLMGNDGVDRSYSLRRIDMSRFFFRASTEGTPTPLDTNGGAGAADPSATEDGGPLPDPIISLRPPRLGHMAGRFGFVLFRKKGNGGHNKVVAIDNTGRSLICDPDLPPTVHTLPNLGCTKIEPFSLTVGDSLYVMDEIPAPLNGFKHHCFEVLLNDDQRNFTFKGWRWSPLDPPPHVHAYNHLSTNIDSYTVVAGSNILVSNKASTQTHCFDTVDRKWSKAGDWVLPFTRLAEYLPEHKLWFGISSIEEGYHFCAANLVTCSDSGEMRPPVVHSFWKDYTEPPPEWSLAEAYAVHLGSSKFCIVRLFSTGKLHVCLESHNSFKSDEGLQVVLTGMEVESCGEEVRVLKHKSERYKLDADAYYRVL